MANDWQEYQDEAAEFFRSLGLEAHTNFTVKGVRTSHEIDVFVKSHHVGFDIAWIVECKFWKAKVSKLHVLALREIVSDIGADRGILLSENGAQSGAIEAATLTNVHVTSLASLQGTASGEIIAMRVRELYDRVEACRERYWRISKNKRIEFGLRPEVGTAGYSANQVIDFATDLISKALRGNYPTKGDSLLALATLDKSHQFSDANEILSSVEPMIAELETKLSTCEESK